jgi:hypothetical protein
LLKPSIILIGKKIATEYTEFTVLNVQSFPCLPWQIFFKIDGMERLRSQILGIIVLAAVLLLIACLRYYFKSG